MKHQGISVFVAREGHCKLSELRRRSEVGGGGRAEVRLWRVNRLPTPIASKSSVGVIQGELTEQELSAWSECQCLVQQASGDQSWGQKTRKQGHVIWIWSWCREITWEPLWRWPEDVSYRPACHHCFLVFGWYLTSCSFVSLSFFMKKKVTKQSLSPDLMLHYLWYLENFFLERTYVLKIANSVCLWLRSWHRALRSPSPSPACCVHSLSLSSK